MFLRSPVRRWALLVPVLVPVVLGGCDVPTGSPSVNTETDLNTPLVGEKTLAFIGGPASDVEPLIDTTTSAFDSLFTVGADPKDVTVVQEVDNFDIGSLDDALDEAGGNLGTDDNFAENLIQNSEVQNQEVDAGYSKENRVYTSSPASATEGGLFDPSTNDAIPVPFPSGVLEAPNFGPVDASGATVESVTLTGETAQVNEITFTLTNNGSRTLDDGNGNPPAIQIEDGSGTVLVESAFNRQIGPGEAVSTPSVDVSGLSVGDGTQFVLLLDSDDTDAANTVELETALSEWRYQATTVSDAGNVVVSVSESSVSTAGTSASQFEGIDVGGGSIDLAVDNQLSFDLSVSTIEFTNAGEPAFGNIPDLGISESFSTPIASGTEATKTVDMGGRGIYKQVDVAVSAQPTNDVITISADDVLNISSRGALDIQTLYFRPGGETLKTSGTVAIDNDRVTFRDGDYVEVSDAVVSVTNLTLEPDVPFDTLAFNYPNVRRQLSDGGEVPLNVRFVENPTGRFEFDRAQLSQASSSFELAFTDESLRLYPSASDEIGFSIRGRMESDPTAEGIVNADDQVAASTSIGDFAIEELNVSGADPFTVEVTQDSDGNGEIDLSSDEARTASFDGFDSFSDRVDGLELANVSLDFSVTTRNLTSTDADVYAAVQGRSDTERTFLAGQAGTNRAVTTPLPFETAFVDAGAPIDASSLIRLGVDLEGASPGQEVTQTLPINEDNSTVSDFVNSLPREVRLIGQAEVNTDGGGLRLLRPIELDAGFTIDVPLQIRNDFVLRDTIDADFSDLENLTDPTTDVTISKAEFRVAYTNRLPLGADAELTIADDGGTALETYTGDDLRIKPAPTGTDGAADGASSGEFVLNLGDTQEALQQLTDGRELQLRLNMTQASDATAARLRADDTITFRLRLKTEASVQLGN